MRIIRMLDLSTAHLPIPLRTADASEAIGGLLWVPDDPDDAANDDGPELLAIRRFARAQACDYVLFDRDADELAELPTFAEDAA